MIMRRIFLILCCLCATIAYAQNIPADSLDYYRKAAHRMYIDKDMSGAIDLYKKLVMSGDALSGYQLSEIYSQGQGVPKDEIEAKKWLSMAQEILAEKEHKSHTKPAEDRPCSNEPRSLEALFHESGTLIAKGAKEKNIALAVGLAGAATGGALAGIGATQQAHGAVIAGGIVAGGCGVAALVLAIVGNHHIKEGGELMRRVQITGDGITVKF